MEFSKKYYSLILYGLLTPSLLSCDDKASKSTNNPGKSNLTDTISQGYNELANPDNQKSFTISDFNTGNPEITNIDRPGKSIINTKLDTTLLFGIWTSDPNGPHADFKLTSKSFYVVDYDGDGAMPFELYDNKLKIYYNDFIQEGRIISVDKDTLKIYWKGFDSINSFVRWTQ